MHPAEERAGDRVPSFVTRDIDDALQAALRSSRFVLLIGESTAGKTRAAYEAMRAVLADHRLVRPADRRPMSAMVSRAARCRRCVVWLDDLERYLGVAGLTTDLLDQILTTGRDVVVLATMRSQEHGRYDRWQELSLDDTRLEIWRRGRQVLERAHRITVDRRWSFGEIGRAGRLTDPRIAAAIERAGNRGIAEST